MPEEFGKLVAYVKANTPGMEKATLSVHCHDDLGLAVANTLAAAAAGADQLECTINGIGERAGNASLEEIAMGIRTRKELLGLECRIDTPQIYATSRLVSKVTGVKVQPNKAVVGENAFAHEAGIHQHGILANRMTYEIMTPESVGFLSNRMVLGKHSGRHAFEGAAEKPRLRARNAAGGRTFRPLQSPRRQEKNHWRQGYRSPCRRFGQIPA